MQGDYNQNTLTEVGELMENCEQLLEENKMLHEQVALMQAAQTTKKKIEFSKIIFIGVSVATIAITVFSCLIIWQTKDTTALAYLIPAVFAEMAAATGFYYTKAKAENKIKLMAQYGVEVAYDGWTAEF